MVLLRSMLFVPGHNAEYLEMALISEADALIIDLEDSVALKENKLQARIIGSDFIRKNSKGSKRIFIRINDSHSEFYEEDIQSFLLNGVDGFLLPKVCTEQDILSLSKRLDDLEEKNQFSSGYFKIIPIIETCEAVFNVVSICRSSSRVIAVAFGCEDFIADLFGMHDEESESLATPRALIAIGARAAGVIPVDTVHVRVHDMEDLEKNLQFSKKLGFEGMLILHPKEIAYAHRYYTPSDTEYQEAGEMLRLYQLSAEKGKGVAVHQGRFIGPPMVLLAEKIIKRYEYIYKERLK